MPFFSKDPSDQVASVRNFLGEIQEGNVFVLNFIKPRTKNDPAYPLVKHLVGHICKCV